MEVTTFQMSTSHKFLAQVTLLPMPCHQVNPLMLPFSDRIKLLGVTLDSNVKFDQHITTLSKSCFFHIRALHHNRLVLTNDTARTMAASLIGSRLDYANSILYGSTTQNIACVQLIQNALAKVVMPAPLVTPTPNSRPCTGYPSNTEYSTNLQALPSMPAL